MFKVGQKVVAITNPLNSGSQPRKKGEIYTVKDVRYCPKTGYQYINIGCISQASFFKCSNCGSLHESFGKYWTRSKHFKPLYYDFVEEVLKQIKEEPQTV